MGITYIHKILSNPYVHNFVQKILLIGRSGAVKSTEQCIKNCHGKVLDIGCGTGRYAHLFKDNYYGIDIITGYLKNRPEAGKDFVSCDAGSLPFKSRFFDSIFSVGFFHHVDAVSSGKVYKEIIRVCKPHSTILIIDAFYPDSKFDVLGYALMKMDRGRYTRSKGSYIEELQDYFDIVQLQPISNSYPYHLFSFILQVRDGN